VNWPGNCWGSTPCPPATGLTSAQIVNHDPPFDKYPSPPWIMTPGVAPKLPKY
jgi:hypothetical protein